MLSDANSGSSPPPALIPPIATHHFMPYLHREGDQVRHQMKYYQDMWAAQNQAVVPHQMSPIKYDNVVAENKNSNFFVVWVPVVWMPHNYNKDIAVDDGYRLM